MYFGEDKTKSIVFFNAKGLKEIIISFTGHCVKQHKTIDNRVPRLYLGFELKSKLSGKIPVYKKQLPNSCV